MKTRAMFAYLIAQMLDLYTSFLPSSGIEMNHFARTAHGQPILSHLVVIKIAFVLWPGSLILLAYLQLRRMSQWLADCFVVGILLWYTQDIFLVVLENWLLSKGWYN